MNRPIVIDGETQLTFRDVGGYHPEKLKISVACIYDYNTNLYSTFSETELPQMFRILEQASVLIGFNLIDFDLQVLKPYYVGNITKLTTHDLLQDVEKSLGFRVALDDLVRETLGVKKTGHGLLAVEYFREGQIEKLKEYCLSDVKLTRELYEYGKQHGKVYFNTANGRREIPIDWNKTYENQDVNLTLPW